MPVLKNILVVAAFVTLTAGAVTVETESRDPAAKFAAKDLSRILADREGRIVLREDPSLPNQTWRFRSEADGRLAISGQDALCVAHGVYAFLEEYAGVRWFAQDTEVIPDLASWKMPTGLDKTVTPAFYQRQASVGVDFLDGIWRLRNRATMRAAFQGYVGGSPGDSHTFKHYANAIRKDHPELFVGRQYENGRPCEDLCLSDPKTRELVAEQMCRYIAADREKVRANGRSAYHIPKIYELSQNDGGSGTCMCPGCRKLHDAAGSYSGPIIDFVSDVARRVAKTYPDIRVRTLAYSYGQNPPTNDLVAADNVIVRYCCSWLFDPLLRGTPQGDKLERWAKHVKHFGIWGYWRTYRGVLFPFVKKRAEMRDELRFCQSVGANGYYCEDEMPLLRSFSMLQFWLFLKMTEDPSQDIFALSREFMRGYYGAAAAPMTAYLDYLERRQKSGVGCLDVPQKQHLDREFFEKVNAWLDEAERLAAGDARTLNHVHWERVIVDRSMYDVMATLQKQGYRYDAKAVAARFMANAREQLETWSELQTAERRPQKVQRLANLEIEADLYAHYPIPMPREFEGRDVETLEWNKIAPRDAKYVKDPDAVAGTAFTHPKFGDRFPFLVGFYNPLRKEDKATLAFKKPADVPQDEKYHLHRLGRATIMTPLYLHYSAQGFRAYLTTLGIVPEERDIWLSIKFQGPAFVPGSKKENLILVDRGFLVKP